MAGKAEARLIYSSISSSLRIADLGVSGALLFTWLITHCDAQGRMLGDPRIIKQIVIPFIKEIEDSDIPGMLNSMGKAKLIIQYQDKKGRSLIQVADWWDYQDKLMYRGESRYDPPQGWENRLTERGGNGRFVKRED